MTEVPAGWYDDPEDPQQFRYWDGTEWSDHRSPKSAAPTGDSAGAWSVVGTAVRLAGRNWRELVILAVPVVLVSVLATVLLLSAIDAALDPNLADIQERLTEPSFDPFDDAEGTAYIESISISVDAGTAVRIAAGILLFTVGGVAATSILTVFLAAAHRSRALELSAVVRLGLSRLPRVIGVYLLWMLGLTALLLPLLAVTLVAPLSLILTIPAAFAAMIYFYPTILLSFTALLIGDQTRPPLRSTFALIRPQWGRVAIRVLVLSIALVGVSLAASLGSAPFNATSIWAGFLVSSLLQAVQTVLAAAGGIVVYDEVGGTFDPAISPPTS